MAGRGKHNDLAGAIRIHHTIGSSGHSASVHYDRYAGATSVPSPGTGLSSFRLSHGKIMLCPPFQLCAHQHSSLTRPNFSFQEAESDGVNEDCSKVLKRLIPVLENQESLYATASNDYIAEGSYIVSMPISNGQTAQAIFAPGEESLEHIKSMLDSTEDHEDIEIRQLQQVRLIGKGKGCRLFSKSL